MSNTNIGDDNIIHGDVLISAVQNVSNKTQEEWDKSKHRHANNREAEFTTLFKEYTNDYKGSAALKLDLKKKFYSVIMGITVYIALSPVFFLSFVSIINAVSVRELDNSFLAIAFGGSFINLLTGLIVLPKIIAKYLFNQKEETERISLVKEVLNYNAKLHKNT